jgi:hypothetical protein
MKGAGQMILCVNVPFYFRLVAISFSLLIVLKELQNCLKKSVKKAAHHHLTGALLKLNETCRADDLMYHGFQLLYTEPESIFLCTSSSQWARKLSKISFLRSCLVFVSRDTLLKFYAKDVACNIMYLRSPVFHTKPNLFSR